MQHQLQLQLQEEQKEHDNDSSKDKNKESEQITETTTQKETQGITKIKELKAELAVQNEKNNKLITKFLNEQKEHQSDFDKLGRKNTTLLVVCQLNVQH